MPRRRCRSGSRFATGRRPRHPGQTGAAGRLGDVPFGVGRAFSGSGCRGFRRTGLSDLCRAGGRPGRPRSLSRPTSAGNPPARGTGPVGRIAGKHQIPGKGPMAALAPSDALGASPAVGIRPPRLPRATAAHGGTARQARAGRRSRPDLAVAERSINGTDCGRATSTRFRGSARHLGTTDRDRETTGRCEVLDAGPRRWPVVMADPTGDGTRGHSEDVGRAAGPDRDDRLFGRPATRRPAHCEKQAAAALRPPTDEPRAILLGAGIGVPRGPRPHSRAAGRRTIFSS